MTRSQARGQGCQPMASMGAGFPSDPGRGGLGRARAEVKRFIPAA